MVKYNSCIFWLIEHFIEQVFEGVFMGGGGEF